MMDTHVDILGVRVTSIDGPAMLGRFRDMIRNNERGVFAYVNIHAVNLARKSERFRAMLNGADAAYPDGEGVRLGARILGRQLPPSTALTRWIWDVASFCAAEGYGLFLLGSKPEHAAEAARRMAERFPALRIGFHHGYFSESETGAVIEAIHAAAPHILLVGLGMPKQEEWIALHHRQLAANIILPAGSAIDFAAGVFPVCPRWIARLGFEWLFRLMLEPKRLYRRYLAGNVRFLVAVIAQRLSQGRA